MSEYSPSLTAPQPWRQCKTGRRPRQQAFTLIEIIVVVLIIGVIVSFAALSIDGRAIDDRLTNEARRLNELTRLASDEAVLLGIEIGMRSKDGRYEFLVINEESNWITYPTDGPLRPRRLPDGVELLVTTEAFPALPVEQEKKLPQILFLSSGEVTPFEILLSAQGTDQRFQITGNITGKISMQVPDPDQRR